MQPNSHLANQPASVPTASFRDFEDLLITIRIFGFDAETSFITAMQLKANGVTSHGARKMFYAALKRTQ
jgi:hypothetical protein